MLDRLVSPVVQFIRGLPREEAQAQAEVERLERELVPARTAHRTATAARQAARERETALERQIFDATLALAADPRSTRLATEITAAEAQLRALVGFARGGLNHQGEIFELLRAENTAVGLVQDLEGRLMAARDRVAGIRQLRASEIGGDVQQLDARGDLRGPTLRVERYPAENVTGDDARNGL